MTILSELRTFILADPAVAALIGARMYPVSLPQAVAFPAVTYQVISAIRVPTMLHADNLPGKRIQIDAWSPSSVQAEQVAEAIRSLFHYYHPGDMGDVYVAGVFVDLDRTDVDLEGKLHRFSRDYIIYHAE